MTGIQLFVFVICSTVTGWLISWLLTYLLFKSSSTNKGLIPGFTSYLTNEVGDMLQQAFESSTIIDEKISDPRMLEKMKPQIEQHVDFFLNEKLATVFPLLYKFMGEKTLSQFKVAFMTEIDLLFPVIIKNYMSTVKKEIRIAHLISESIQHIPMETARQSFFKSAKKEIFYLRCCCALIGLITGLTGLGIIYFINKPA